MIVRSRERFAVFVPLPDASICFPLAFLAKTEAENIMCAMRLPSITVREIRE